jgi:hypothetical protein
VNVAARSEHILRSRGRRRWRFLAVCVGTAIVCGFVAGVVAPKVLIGGVTSHAQALAAADAEPEGTRPRAVAGAALPIAAALNLDPREERSNLLRWAELPDDSRRALLERYWQLLDLAPDEQQRRFEQYQAFRSQPEDRQEFLRERARKLKEFMGTLSQQDLAVLKGMNDRQRAERLLQLWQARYGTW